MKRDYYEVLGVSRDADDKALKQAYRNLARQHHPDRNPDDPSAEARFKEASEAYTVLSDADARRRYDRMGHAAFESSGPGGFDPSNMGSFTEMFGELFGAFNARRKAKAPGRNVRVEVKVSFEDAALGAEKKVTIRKPAICSTCDGQGNEPGTPVHACTHCQGTGEVRSGRIFAPPRPCPRCYGRGSRVDTPCSTCEGKGRVIVDAEVVVRVPAGVEDGAVQSLRGGGEEGPGGAGDLHITISIEPHPLFERTGADVRCTVPITFPEAVLGTDLDVPTLSGKVKMKLPAGTPSGKVFRLRGKGIAAYGGVAKGDQLVTVIVEVPEKINREQRQLIEELASEMGTETLPQRRSFIDKLKELFE